VSVPWAGFARTRPVSGPVSWRQEMGKKLYVGNLAYGVTDGDLAKLFEAHGTVELA
jgi:RNA recognition motif-containing protein